MTDVLRMNLLSPLVLAFALGVIARSIKSEFTLPKDLYQSLAIYLLLAIGLKGGVELAHATPAQFAWPALATVFLGCLTPILAYLGLRKLGRFSVPDSAGIAAHYGSVSAVTFIAAQQFVSNAGFPAEGFMPTLLTLLESPGIHIALGIGALHMAKQTSLRRQPVLVAAGDMGSVEGSAPPAPAALDWRHTLREVLTARTMILLVGGLVIGFLIGDRGWHNIQPFFEGGFKGALTLFLLEMGLVAGERLGDLKKVGGFLIAFGIGMPIVNGLLGVLLGHAAGLSVGGAAVLGTMAASASYIAAPPAVRMTLPQANPTYYLTLALGITFPFNILIGIPLYFQISRMLAA